VLVYREGTWIYTRWQEVKIGDIVKVIDREYFPADLVLISSRLILMDLEFLEHLFFSLVNHSQFVIFKHPILMEKPI